MSEPVLSTSGPDRGGMAELSAGMAERFTRLGADRSQGSNLASFIHNFAEVRICTLQLAQIDEESTREDLTQSQRGRRQGGRGRGGRKGRGGKGGRGQRSAPLGLPPCRLPPLSTPMREKRPHIPVFIHALNLSLNFRSGF